MPLTLAYFREMLPWHPQRTEPRYSPVSGDDRRASARSSTGDDDDGNKEQRLQDSQDGRVPPSSLSQRPAWKNPRFLLGHGLVAAAYFLFLTLTINNKCRDKRSTGMPFSPAIGVLEFSETFFTLEDKIETDGVWSGTPTDTIDKSWHDLVEAENIVLEPQYIERYGRQSSAVAVPEGSGYIGTLNVYHELHCLKRIRQYMYKDYYFPNLTEHDEDINRSHNEHCIDFLRQSAMCHGDVGLITYDWHPLSSVPVAHATSHQCINWDKLEKFMKARAVDMFKPGWLTHPTRGPAYQDEKSQVLGTLETSHH